MWDSPQNPARAIPIIGTDLPVNLVKLPKVNVCPKPLTDRAHVRLERISGDLITTDRALPQIEDKPESVKAIPSADMMRDHQFGVAVHAKPQVKAAPLFGIVKAKVVFLRVDETPHLIKLDESRRDLLHFGIENLAGLLCRCEHQRKNRVLVQPRKPGDRPDAYTLKHERENLYRSLRIGVMRSELRGGSGKCSAAGLAALALNTALTVVPELSASSVRASDAGHGVSPLDFCAEKRHNEFGSGLWFTPRFGLAPPTARTADGALFVSYLGWWLDRDLYGLTGSESDLDSDHAGFILPESPVDAGLSHLTPKSFLVAPNRRSQLLLDAANPISLLTYFIDKRFHLFRLNHPAKCGMDGCRRIRVVGEVHKFRLLDSDSYYSRRESIGVGAEKSANCAYESRFTAEFIQRGQIFSFYIFVLANSRKRLDSSREAHYMFFLLLHNLYRFFEVGHQCVQRRNDWRFRHECHH